VAIDRRLLDVLQKAVYGRRDRAKPQHHMPARIEIESKRPLREIQQFLRAGQSPAQVARAAGVTEEYVEQFLTPVLYERAGVIQDAQALYQEKQRLGPSSLPLGEAVAANLVSRRVRLDEDALADAWMATRQEGQPWIVSLIFPFRGRARTARWRFDPRTRSLEPANKLAIDVGWIGGSRSRAQVPSPNGSKPAARARRARPLEIARAQALGQTDPRPYVRYISRPHVPHSNRSAHRSCTCLPSLNSIAAPQLGHVGAGRPARAGGSGFSSDTSGM